jgi:phytoene dehydrogenase-like protein
MRPVVIGSGANGLVAAFYLAKAGHRPIVLEKAEVIGGGAITAEIHPRFQVPFFSHELLLHDTIARDMNLPAHGLRWIDTDAEACAPSLDGPPLVLYADASRSAGALRAMAARDAEAWMRYRDAMTGAARVIGPLLQSAPPLSTGISQLWQLLAMRRRLGSIGDDARNLFRWLPMPVSDFVHEWFEDDRLRALLAAEPLSGTMLAPRSAGSTLILLLREAHKHLARRPGRVASGGPGACMQALAAAARAAGADIQTGALVERILTRANRVTGLVVGGRELRADLVISTLDPKTTLLALLDRGTLSSDLTERLVNYRASGTMAKVNLALDALPRFTGVGDEHALTGRIHLGASHVDDIERAFDAVKYGEMSAQPWLDVRIPSIRDATLAPAGKHVGSIYVHNAPHTLHTGTWADASSQLLQQTLAVLEAHAPGTASLVLAAQVMTPADLESRLGTAGGHIFHGEIAPDQLFSVRPVIGLGGYGTPIGGLYLGGAGTHPGGFLTGASGRLAARAALRQDRRQPSTSN